MNQCLEEYIVAINDYGTVTEAAAHLFITPSALNQQLLKLEARLGLPLFIRNHHRLEPTPAGRIYLEGARQILSIRQQTSSSLSDLAGDYSGEYRIGFFPGGGVDAFTYSYAEFHEKYPNIMLLCREMMVSEQIEKVRTGELDLGVLVLDSPPATEDHYILLSQANQLLGMPVSHPLSHLAARCGEPLTTIDLSLLRDTPFAMMSRNSSVYNRVTSLFRQAGYLPKNILESAKDSARCKMAAQQICCTVVQQYYATDWERLVWFYLPTHPRLSYYVIYRKGTRPNRAMSDLIELLRNYAQKNWNFPAPESLGQ